MKRLLPKKLKTYLAALLFVCAATIALTLLTDPWLGSHTLITVSYAIAALAVWIGGVSWLAARRYSGFLGMALEAANMNTFEVDLDRRTSRRSHNAARFYGLGAQACSLDEWLSFIHPEDAARHADAVRSSRETGTYCCRFRFIRPVDQRLMWIEAHGSVVRNLAGRMRLTGVAFDVTARVSLEQQMARQTETLQRTNENKSEFIALLAHELRNPLAPIKAGIALMKKQRVHEDSRNFTLEVLERQAARIEALVEDLVDIGRIEQGKLVLDRRSVDLARVVERAVEAALPHVEAKAQRLSVSLPENPLRLSLDEARMMQVVNNLLNNGCKFTQRGGRISIQLARDGGLAKLIVADDGSGIAPEQLDAIFEAYVQSGKPSGRAGLGLGLSLCKALVQMHGGRIQAKSEGLGKGSEFIVCLPMGAGAAEPDVPGITEPKALTLSF